MMGCTILLLLMISVKSLYKHGRGTLDGAVDGRVGNSPVTILPPSKGMYSHVCKW